MMRVVLLSSFPVWNLPGTGLGCPTHGHANSWLVELPEALAGIAGLEPHWITLHEKAIHERKVEHRGNVFWVLPTQSKGRASTFYWKDRARLQKKIREIGPDVVHGWGSEDVFGWAAVRSGYPHLLSMQGILSNLVRQGSLPLRTRIQALLEIYLLRKAGVVTVESEWGRQMIQRIRGPKPIHVIEYGVQKVFYQAVWRPLPECPSCLFVGTLNRQKGIQDLVEAFRDPRLRKYELRVIGEGDPNWVRPLQANAPPNVKWLGRRSPQEVAAQMEKSWCLALPTRADTSPNVVKEARVVGLPVVTTSAGGQAQYVVDGEDGYLCGPKDIPLWVDRLQTLLADLKATQRAGALGQKRYREIFVPEKTARAYYSIYLKLSAQISNPYFKD